MHHHCPGLILNTATIKQTISLYSSWPREPGRWGEKRKNRETIPDILPSYFPPE